jgi:hypothetical protein
LNQHCAAINQFDPDARIEKNGKMGKWEKKKKRRKSQKTNANAQLEVG